ncbi:hypothetical protein AGR1A_pAt20328 [Agrobacterium fabacearum CFBP 5771]|nr:hypothetical protein AGR1A_pAt20328 [Agrobacterium fabacearum CFBP 5771]
MLEPPALSRPASASYLGALRPAWKAPSLSIRIDVAKSLESVQTVKIRRAVLRYVVPVTSSSP